MSSVLAAVDPHAESPAFLAGGGEMGARIRGFDWESTPLGPPTRWPMPLQVVVRILLASREPLAVWWGGGTTLLYNDACRDLPPMPPCPPDLHQLWPRWISEGWFPWQSDGWPHSGNLYHTASWWRFRHLPNIGFVHYADLLADLPGEIERIAAFVGLPLDRERRDAVAGAVSLDALRRDPGAGPLPDARMREVWRDGRDTFFFKGTNGRWRGVLTPDELELYEAAKARCLTPDCAAYLEGGRAALLRPGPGGTAPTDRPVAVGV